jgi:hypothetical protein
MDSVAAMDPGDAVRKPRQVLAQIAQRGLGCLGDMFADLGVRCDPGGQVVDGKTPVEFLMSFSGQQIDRRGLKSLGGVFTDPRAWFDSGGQHVDGKLLGELLMSPVNAQHFLEQLKYFVLAVLYYVSLP